MDPMKKRKILRNVCVSLLFVLIFVGSLLAIIYLLPDQFVKIEKNEIAAPSFKTASGFYEKPFYLRINVPNGTRVYYTTDCTAPTTSSTLYKEPIYVYDRSAEENIYRSVNNVIKNYDKNWVESEKVDKGFVVRAIAVDAFDRVSEVVTSTYFIGLDKYKDANVVSIVAEPDDLFGPDGIYVTGSEYDEWLANNRSGDEPTCNFLKKGDDWERAAGFEYFENSREVLNQQVGIRIQGNHSRNLIIKRFSIFSREKYSGSDYFEAPVVNGNLQHSFYTRAGDLQYLSQEICDDRDVLTVDSKKIVLFVNGEYWCGEEQNWYLYEKFSEENIAQKYSVNADDVVIVKNGEITKKANFGTAPFYKIENFLTVNVCSKSDAYYELDKILDMQSYIDAVCIHMYMANIDTVDYWNNFYWHCITEQSGDKTYEKWRLGLYDLDSPWDLLSREFKVDHPYEIDPFTMHAENVIAIGEWQVFSSFKENPVFRERFINTFIEIMTENFDYEKVEKIMKKAGIEKQEYYEFFSNRKEYMIKFLIEEFPDHKERLESAK